MRECFRMKKMSQQQSSAFFRMDWGMCGNYVAKRYLDPRVSNQVLSLSLSLSPPPPPLCLPSTNTGGQQVYWDDIQLQMECKAWAHR
jgi:hypothetical protein